MMIKITESCSMGCIHCMNNAKPNGNNMTDETFRDVLDFIRCNGLDTHIMITGGEPTEHPEFINMMNVLCQYIHTYYDNSKKPVVSITTNGLWMQNNPQVATELIEHMRKEFSLIVQVSTDERYYPTKIETHKRVFHNPSVTIIDSIDIMYPIGRALDNNIPWERKSPSCFNVRAIAKQISSSSLNKICNILLCHDKYCTPHIRYNGDIALGESDLCPAVSNIYKSESEIVESIINCKCLNCKCIIDKMPDDLKQFLL